jgi:hypothetical protein
LLRRQQWPFVQIVAIGFSPPLRLPNDQQPDSSEALYVINSAERTEPEDRHPLKIALIPVLGLITCLGFVTLKRWE